MASPHRHLNHVQYGQRDEAVQLVASVTAEVVTEAAEESLRKPGNQEMKSQSGQIFPAFLVSSESELLLRVLRASAV